MTSAGWRRRVLATAVGNRIRVESCRIAGERGCSYLEAEAAVFADPELLRKCHEVGGAAVPEQPVSTVAAQNR